MAIKAVFFDAAGTLIKPVRNVGESYAWIARNHGMDVAPSEISARFRLCFAAAPPLAFPGAAARDIQILERNWWRRLVERIFEPWGPFDGFDDYFAELFSYFAAPGSWALYPEVRETLSALKERPVILSVISNFDSRLVNILEGLGTAPFFADIFISSRVGHAKPAREIFDAALSRHGLAARTALHVGDSSETDVRGAIDAGLRGVLVDRDGHYEPECFPRICSLKELLSFVEQDEAGPSKVRCRL
jgi:putative hydrolase of the HAD superfamily